MGMDISYILHGEGLQITVDGNLDLTLTRPMLGVCAQVDDRLLVCVIDCSRVIRVFDSGRALLMLLTQKLQAFEVKVIVIGDIPAVDYHVPPESTLRTQSVNERQERPFPG
ncbi:hypothetical protein [Sedimenticola hydrogenitrophicus]|uniref:hypothetical protein n=1 Tax=Sedimenticola hydrogenitrophicus TaxID=2967975 RepID=UPI0023AE85C2|nr:hypothetical protein [Sedimenticola hydrogenitrophicus]